MKLLHVFTLLSISVLTMMSGCASYTTPGGPVDLASIDSEEIAGIMARKPAAHFPVVLAFARIQSPSYKSYSANTYGTGAYSVVTTREFMSDAEASTLAGFPGVQSVTPLSRLLLPSQLESLRDLRTAAASLKSDILLVFTIDTSFRVDGKTIGPLSLVSLGMLRDRETVVTSTASAIFVDTRSGYVYGVSEASATETKTTSAWGSASAVDQSRLITEREAFGGLMRELKNTWQGIVTEYADNAA
ncbi:MAG: hypothetical protein WBM54_09160 [Woeseia sp.]